MSLESSHERIEQERPRSATAAETDHSPAVQGDCGGEQLPANVTPAPVPLDSDELVALLLSWIRTPDWSTSRTYLQAHSQLLTEVAAQILATLTQHQPDQQVHELLMLHQQLLQRAGQQGVEAAYQSLLHQEEKNDSQEVATYQAFQDPATLNDAGMAALYQYWASGQVADLNRAVECWHEALNLPPPTRPSGLPG